MEMQGRQIGNSTVPRATGRTAQTINSGLWKFVNSSTLDATINSMSNYRHDDAPDSAMGKLCDEGAVLSGEHYRHWLDVMSDPTKYPYTPRWSPVDASVRGLLPQLVFNDKAELALKSGIYELTIQYKRPEVTDQDTAIIVGEIEFDSKGYVLAEGADWDRLLKNQRQTQLPYSHGARVQSIWHRRKISEPWADGDILKFKVDTDENTVVFKKGSMPEKAFWNVDAFTNNPKFPEFLRVYAYRGFYGYNGRANAHTKLAIVS